MSRRIDTATRSVLVLGNDDLKSIVKDTGLELKTVEIKPGADEDRLGRDSYSSLLVALENMSFLLIDARERLAPVAAYAAGYAASRGRTVIGIRDSRRAACDPEHIVITEFAYWVETLKEVRSVLDVLNKGGRELDNDGTWGGGGH